MKRKDEIIIKRGEGRPRGSRDKKKRRPRRDMKKLIADIRADIKRKKAKREKREAMKRHLATEKGKLKEIHGVREETCGIKIVALVVKVKGGESRVKVGKNEAPKLAPCEELVCKITYEKNGIPVHSIFSEVRHFAEALAKCSGENLLHE